MTLSDFQTPDGWFTIAPFDHRASLAESLHLDLNNLEHQQKFLELKRLFIKIFSPHISAVLTDPEYGIKTLGDKDPDCGLFLSLEESGYSGDHDALTTLKPNWGVDGVKSYNAGAKLLVYYNPRSSSASQKLDLVKQLAEECKNKQVAFLVEPVLHSLPGVRQWIEEGDQDWIELHLSVCQAIAPYSDILKIQYPGNAEACQAISRFHKNWILLSRGARYETFTGYMTIAARNGSKGYAAGRAVWQEITTLDSSQWEQFLQTTAVDRLNALTRILQTSNLLA